MTQPFIFSKTDECFEDEVLKKAIKNFASLFKESSIRVTEGRAQAPVNADIGQGFAAKFEKKATFCDNHIDVVTKMGSEDQKAYPDLAKAMSAWLHLTSLWESLS